MTQNSYEHQPPGLVKCHCIRAKGHSLIILILSGMVRKHKSFIYQRKAIGPSTVTHHGPDAIVAVYIFKSEKLTRLSYFISLELTNNTNKKPQEAHKENLLPLIHFRKARCHTSPLSSPRSIYQNFIKMSNGLQRL